MGIVASVTRQFWDVTDADNADTASEEGDLKGQSVALISEHLDSSFTENENEVWKRQKWEYLPETKSEEKSENVEKHLNSIETALICDNCELGEESEDVERELDSTESDSICDNSELEEESKDVDSKLGSTETDLVSDNSDTEEKCNDVDEELDSIESGPISNNPVLEKAYKDVDKEVHSTGINSINNNFDLEKQFKDVDMQLDATDSGTIRDERRELREESKDVYEELNSIESSLISNNSALKEESKDVDREVNSTETDSINDNPDLEEISKDGTELDSTNNGPICYNSEFGEFKDVTKMNAMETGLRSDYNKDQPRIQANSSSIVIAFLKGQIVFDALDDRPTRRGPICGNSDSKEESINVDTKLDSTNDSCDNNRDWHWTRKPGTKSKSAGIPKQLSPENVKKIVMAHLKGQIVDDADRPTRRGPICGNSELKKESVDTHTKRDSTNTGLSCDNNRDWPWRRKSGTKSKSGGIPMQLSPETVKNKLMAHLKEQIVFDATKDNVKFGKKQKAAITNKDMKTDIENKLNESLSDFSVKDDSHFDWKKTQTTGTILRYYKSLHKFIWLSKLLQGPQGEWQLNRYYSFARYFKAKLTSSETLHAKSPEVSFRNEKCDYYQFLNVLYKKYGSFDRLWLILAENSFRVVVGQSILECLNGRNVPHYLRRKLMDCVEDASRTAKKYRVGLSSTKLLPVDFPIQLFGDCPCQRRPIYVAVSSNNPTLLEFLMRNGAVIPLDEICTCHAEVKTTSVHPLKNIIDKLFMDGSSFGRKCNLSTRRILHFLLADIPCHSELWTVIQDKIQQQSGLRPVHGKIPKLKHTCRTKIRQIMRECNSLSHCVDELPLPKHLRLYLALYSEKNIKKIYMIYN